MRILSIALQLEVVISISVLVTVLVLAHDLTKCWHENEKSLEYRSAKDHDSCAPLELLSEKIQYRLVPSFVLFPHLFI